ncbi:UDP-N-acetylglucosamine--undecaprenyl-phosphate N-acetylglucosaminephosphotransferase [Vibrio sp. 10N.261.51.F12]|uniref:UDP-N-acetylglucosamine--undecaprenyl-phosphate N-acetylglucosaminephosphotransferase n=1 Tax=Vibrio sp. 10N.261.51.F12 TaxID=3229679 RepID=UPI00354D9B41
MLIDLLYVSFVSLTALFVLRKWARKIGLVDISTARKQHTGKIPLVGGIAVYIAVSQYLYLKSELIPDSYLLLILLGTLVILGALDDKYDVSFKLRLLVQAGLALCMVYFSDLQLKTLGDLLSFGDVNLGPFLGVVVTVVAVIGAINAFNMVDGIDGLLGGLSIVTFSGLAILMYADEQSGFASLCLVFIAALIPYVALNLGYFERKRKVFMGDAGSMMIGFSVVWLLLAASQGEPNTLMQPVTALWLIAIPLMDMTAVMIRRTNRGDSPFKPDREHLHHIFQRYGYSSTQTLMIICLCASLFAGVGIAGEWFNAPESLMFSLFIICFILYFVILNVLDKSRNTTK